MQIYITRPKSQIARKLTSPEYFFLSEFFQYNDDFYGDLYGDFYGDVHVIVDTFVATNFPISFSSSLYMILI